VGEAGAKHSSAGGLHRMGRAAEALLPAPIAAGMERGLRSWLSRRYTAREHRVTTAWNGVATAPTDDDGQVGSPSCWQLFPATTRFRILEAYRYRLRCFGLETGRDFSGASARTAAPAAVGSRE
jgi:hypothetical protein